MNKFLFIASLIFTVALFGNCKLIHNTIATGEIINHVSTFWKFEKNNDTPYIKLSEKAWYQDSVGITQICRIWFVQTADSNESIDIQTIGYRFVDLKKKWAYEYTNFSDTASVTKKYRYTDTTIFSGGWNFAQRTPLSVDSFLVLPDTIINAVTYKQRRISYLFNKNKWEGICLFRCDLKNMHFQIDTAISNKIGCPLVSFRYYPIENPHARLDREVKFISNQFPGSVVRVFAAWKRNEIKYPVQ